MLRLKQKKYFNLNRRNASISTEELLQFKLKKIFYLYLVRIFYFRLKLLWLTLTQVNTSCEIEFLPVYRPSEEEKRDPKLFANNVRKVMAK